MRLLGLIGYPLDHSFSESYFKTKFRNEKIGRFVYRNFPISSIKKILDLFEEYPELEGLNVTIPYKEQVIQYIDKLDTVAEAVGAVNTIVVKQSEKNIRLYGYNTDVAGFTNTLKPLLKSSVKSALVLGTGGASKAIRYALKNLGIDHQLVSRSKKKDQISYNDISAEIIRNHLLIVNTTPLGTFPDIHNAPAIPYELLTENHILYDLVYNPEETLFLKKGKDMGAITKNGYDMLVAQAEESWRIWNKK